MKIIFFELHYKITEAIKIGRPYQAILDPPPDPPTDENGNFLPLPEWKPGQPKPPNWPVTIHCPFKKDA